MKRISLTLHADSLPAAHAWHSVEVEGSTIATAVAKGVRELLKRDHVKGKRLREFTLTVERLGDSEAQGDG